MSTITTIDNLFDENGWILGNAARGGPIQLAIKRGSRSSDRWHYHEETHEYFIVLGGWVELETEEGARMLNKGNIVCIPPKMAHHVLRSSEDCILMLLMDRYVSSDKVIVGVG